MRIEKKSLSYFIFFSFGFFNLTFFSVLLPKYDNKFVMMENGKVSEMGHSTQALFYVKREFDDLMKMKNFFSENFQMERRIHFVIIKFIILHTQS